MPVYRGTHFTKRFTLKQKSDEAPLDITLWEFRSQIREHADSEAVLLELDSAGGGFSILDGPGGRLELHITAAQTAALPIGWVVFDVLRTDAAPGPTWQFGGRFKVEDPVTRDE